MKCKNTGCNKEVIKSQNRIKLYCSVVCASRFRVKKRRKNLKLMGLEYKGGKCQYCGYNKCVDALQFHHLDPTQKDFGLSQRGLTRSWKRIKLEIDKCILLCSNCHFEEHNRIRQDAR